MEAGLVVRDLTLRRGARVVLERVSFELAPCEIVAVIGANGAGKTSLLEAVVGFHRLDAGSVHHDGRALSGLSARVFSFMPDQAEPPAEVRVGALLEHAIRIGVPAEGLGPRLISRLGLEPLRGALAGELSRGERRRLLLFGALATRRPVIVLDEPLGAFDPLQLLDVLAILRERAGIGAAILLSVHQLSDAEKIAGRVLLLDGGRVLAFGTLAALEAEAGLPGAPLEAVFLALLAASNQRRSA